MSRIRAWLQLIRVAALPTTLADVWMGAALVTPFWRYLDNGLRVAALSGVSLALYAAGMILNDVQDVESDRADNPKRPLPRGAVSVARARTVGLALLIVAVGGACALGMGSGVIAVLLAISILAYDFGLSRTFLGPFAMGGCRALNVCLGMSVGWLNGGRELLTLWHSIIPVLVYVICVTWIARQEARQPRRRALVLPLLGMLMAVALASSTPFHWARAADSYWGAWRDSLMYHSIAPIVVLLLFVALAWVHVMRRKSNVRRAVSCALMGIMPLQAVVAAAQDELVAYAILLLIIPVILLRRLSHIT
jgi:UbiA prenyltransferase family protein